jgi:Flp pilus assembly protein TadB
VTGTGKELINGNGDGNSKHGEKPLLLFLLCLLVVVVVAVVVVVVVVVAIIKITGIVSQHRRVPYLCPSLTFYVPKCVYQHI